MYKNDDNRGPKVIDKDGSRYGALSKNLEIIIERDTGTKKKRNEVKYFVLYLNYALSNIREITGIKEDGARFATAVNSLSDERLSQLADFLWTFRFDEPQMDFASRNNRNFDYRHLAKLVAIKIFELRNWFVHSDRSGNSELVCNRDLYVLLEGLLRPKAEESALGRGCKADKVFKMHLLNLREKGLSPKEREYDFTRRGLVFITCMALYKDDAEEFLSCFSDMRLPNRRRDTLDGLSAAQMAELGKKKSTKRALQNAFTFFSYRRGRVSVQMEDSDFLNFTHILGYVNKVPRASFDYLSLENERKILAELCRNSTESEDNKLVKYDLSKQIRQKEKFISLAAAWCEDSGKLTAIRFKRLDITPTVGRKRYRFGKENDNSVRLERHYAIVDDAIRFEWQPKEHYGTVKIGSLRGSIGESEFRKLMWCLCFNANEVNKAIDSYFSNYHKMLELMLNASNTDELSFDNSELMDAVKGVTGVDAETVKANPQLVSKYIPANIARFFSRIENRMTESEMRESLNKRLMSIIARQEDFLVRVGKLRAWRREAKVADMKNATRPVFPTCGKKEVRNPPRECRVSNASCVARVFEWLNFNIYDPEKRFRQLPVGEQHNEGYRDHEYQFAHRAVGKFSFDNKGFWGDGKNCGEIVKLRSELEDAVLALKEKCAELPRGRIGWDILDLAESAAKLNINNAKALLDDGVDDEDLYWWCRLLGIRTGMPLDSESLLKSILGIEIDKWLNAYDYGNGKRYENRKLTSADHIVSQVPLPNGFADRVVLSAPKAFVGVAGEGKVEWSRAFSMLDKKVTEAELRDYYDVSSLIGYIKSHPDHLDESVDQSATGINTWADAEPQTIIPDFSRGGINKAIKAIKTAHNQDRLLLYMAFDHYWKSYNSRNPMDNVRRDSVVAKMSVREYFDGERVRMLGSTGVKLIVSRNDVFSPAFVHVMENARLIAPSLEKEYPDCRETGVCFSDVAQLYTREQRKGRNVRIELIPIVRNFESKCSIPNKAYDEINDKNISIEEKKKEISKMEFVRYQKVFPSLTEEEYGLLADVRNSVMHSSAVMPTAEKVEFAKRVFDRCMREYKPLIKPGTITIKVS